MMIAWLIRCWSSGCQVLLKRLTGTDHRGSLECNPEIPAFPGDGATEEGLTSRGGRYLSLPLRFGLRPQGPCRVGTGESGLVLSEEGNPAGLSSCSGLSRVQLLATPWTAAYQALPPMGFSRQYWKMGCHCLLWQQILQ